MSALLEIKGLRVAVDGKEILRGLDLSIDAGQVHAVMGPNGSGKSTLANVIAGRDGYEVLAGSVTYRGEDLLAQSPEDRARGGVFLGFQYPVEIPGLSTAVFLRAAVNARRKHRGEEELDAMDFLGLVKGRMKELGIREDFLQRAINEGFSGGEKKRAEIFQMALLEPDLVLLDEIDSGLDIDALKIVSEGINRLRAPQRAMLLVTHYRRLLDYVPPDRVHVLSGGQIVRSGGPELAAELEKSGYGWLHEEAAPA